MSLSRAVTTTPPDCNVASVFRGGSAPGHAALDPKQGLGLGSKFVRGARWVHFVRPGTVPHHPKDGFVGRLHRLCLCYPPLMATQAKGFLTLTCRFYLLLIMPPSWTHCFAKNSMRTRKQSESLRELPVPNPGYSSPLSAKILSGRNSRGVPVYITDGRTRTFSRRRW